MNLQDQVIAFLKSRQSRAVIVGALLLAVLAILQVNHLYRNAPMCELLEHSQLSENDLERMQLALGKVGLTDFEIDGDRLLVPKRSHAEYLKAVAQSDAIPSQHGESANETPSINPFMPRAQQKLITQNEKKRKIREMVSRLPFVDQAWFEMDIAEGASAFQPAKQTAVVSVKPPAGVLLDSEQVATLRQMIGGALAGINPQDIVVIDVSSGYAHRDLDGPARFKSVSISKRPVYEQKSYYTNRIRQALTTCDANYDDINVDVQVEMIEVARPAQQVSFQKPVARKVTTPSTAVIGTNGTASIYDQVKVEPEPVVQPPPMPTIDYVSRVEVTLNVPQSIVAELPDDFVIRNPNVVPGVVQPMATSKAKFERLRTDLVERVRQIIPVTSFQQHASFPIAVNLIQAPKKVAATWQSYVAAFFNKHWPSLAVLAIGLVVLSVMTRRNEEDLVSDDSEDEMQDIVSIRSTPSVEEPVSPQNRPDAILAEPEDYAKRDAERKLNRLFEKDPDSAAKVIESWIRDAA